MYRDDPDLPPGAREPPPSLMDLPDFVDPLHCLLDMLDEPSRLAMISTTRERRGVWERAETSRVLQLLHPSLRAAAEALPACQLRLFLRPRPDPPVQERDMPGWWDAVGGAKPPFPVRAVRGSDDHLRALLAADGTIWAVWPVAGAPRCAPVPRDALDGHGVKSIACGSRHMAVIRDDGALLVAGHGPGALRADHAGAGGGDHALPQAWPFARVDLQGQPAAQVFAGDNWTYVRTESGQLWAWGVAVCSTDFLGFPGPLQTGEDSQRLRAPTRVERLSNGEPAPPFARLSINASSHHGILEGMCAVGRDGQLYACGEAVRADRRLRTSQPQLTRMPPPPAPVRDLLATDGDTTFVLEPGGGVSQPAVRRLSHDEAGGPLALLVDGTVLSIAGQRRLPLCRGVVRMTSGRGHAQVRLTKLDGRVIETTPGKLLELARWIPWEPPGPVAVPEGVSLQPPVLGRDLWRSRPDPDPGLWRVRAVASTRDLDVLLLDDGRVQMNNSRPLELLPPVAAVACGIDHVALLTTDGRLLVAGGGPGSLTSWLDSVGSPLVGVRVGSRLVGLQPDPSHHMVFTQAPLGGETAVQIAAGNGWTYARTANGRIWGWGAPEDGPLMGLGPGRFLPSPVHMLRGGKQAPRFSLMSCGPSLDSLWAVDTTGRLYAADPDHGILAPRPVLPPEPVRLLLAHASDPLALLADGSVLALAHMRRLPLCAGVACIVRNHRDDPDLVQFHSFDERVLETTPAELRQAAAWLGVAEAPDPPL